MSNARSKTSNSRTIQDVQRYGMDGRTIEKVQVSVSVHDYRGVHVTITNGVTVKTYLVDMSDWKFLNEILPEGK